VGRFEPFALSIPNSSLIDKWREVVSSLVLRVVIGRRIAVSTTETGAEFERMGRVCAAPTPLSQLSFAPCSTLVISYTNSSLI
jgi:hypothetical protein